MNSTSLELGLVLRLDGELVVLASVRDADGVRDLLGRAVVAAESKFSENADNVRRLLERLDLLAGANTDLVM